LCLLYKMSAAAPTSNDAQKLVEQDKKTEQVPAPKTAESKPDTKPTDTQKTSDTPKASSSDAKTPETSKDDTKKSEAPRDADKEPSEPPKVAPAKKTETPKAAPKKSEPVKGSATPEPPKDGGVSNGGTPTPSEGDATDAAKPPTLREQFRAFSKFGDSKSEGKSLSLSQSDKWMKQAKVVDGKAISTTDTAIAFKKFKQVKLTFPDYDKYLTDLAKYKNTDLAAMKDKMRNCGTPGTRGTTSVAKGGAVSRLTDAKGFTGSHRQRFDGAGKGRGAAGRRDDPDKSGYVSGYKNKDTYSKTH